MSATWAFLSGSDLMPGPDDVRLESPIERSFYRCFHYLCLGLSPENLIDIQTQAQVAGFRVDFILASLDGRRLVAIECDGHDFHDRTKEQAARDKSRDREILQSGFPVMRFTGAELYADPFECAAVALAYAMKLVRTP